MGCIWRWRAWRTGSGRGRIFRYVVPDLPLRMAPLPVVDVVPGLGIVADTFLGSALFVIIVVSCG